MLPKRRVVLTQLPFVDLIHYLFPLLLPNTLFLFRLELGINLGAFRRLISMHLGLLDG